MPPPRPNRGNPFGFVGGIVGNAAEAARRAAAAAQSRNQEAARHPYLYPNITSPVNAPDYTPPAPPAPPSAPSGSMPNSGNGPWGGGPDNLPAPDGPFGSGGPGTNAPTAPTAPAAPAAPKPAPYDYAKFAKDFGSKYKDEFTYDNFNNATWAKAGGEVNDRLAKFGDEQQDPAKAALIKYFQDNGLEYAANQLANHPGLNEVASRETITIPDAMADPNYIASIASLNKQTEDFGTRQATAAGQYRTQLQNSMGDLGLQGGKWNKDNTAYTGGNWDKFDSNNAYGGAYQNNLADFSGRGMGFSSFYGDALTNMNRDFDKRRAQAGTGYTDYLNTQGQDLTEFQGKQDDAKTAALQNAVAAIMAKYGVTAGQVGRGRTNTVTRAIGS